MARRANAVGRRRLEFPLVFFAVLSAEFVALGCRLRKPGALRLKPPGIVRERIRGPAVVVRRHDALLFELALSALFLFLGICVIQSSRSHLRARIFLIPENEFSRQQIRTHRRFHHHRLLA